MLLPACDIYVTDATTTSIKLKIDFAVDCRDVDIYCAACRLKKTTTAAATLCVTAHHLAGQQQQQEPLDARAHELDG